MCKFKGLHNTNTQIRASFSEQGDFILCGSDDGYVYFWTTNAGGEAEPQGTPPPPTACPYSHPKEQLLLLATIPRH